MKTTLLTVKEISSIARVHPITVSRWILKGKLSSVKIGGVRRIPVGALLDFLEESTRRKSPRDKNGDVP